MDISGKELDDLNMDQKMDRQPSPVPTYRLYGENRAESPDFRLHFETLPARSQRYHWEIAPHRHAVFFQLFNITEGGGEALFDTGTEPFSAPAAIFIPAGVAHGFRFLHDSDGMVLTAVADRLNALSAADRRLADILSRPHVVSLAGDDRDAVLASDCLTRIVSEFASRSPGRMALAEALLTEVLVYLARAVGDEPPEHTWAEDRDTARMEELAGLIEIHFRDHRPVGFYAGRLGVSPTHLNRITRRLAGASVSGMLARRIIAEAERELVFTHLAVNAIAYALGFGDAAYFSRFFLRQTGRSPLAFREAERARLAAGG